MGRSTRIELRKVLGKNALCEWSSFALDVQMFAQKWNVVSLPRRKCPPLGASLKSSAGARSSKVDGRESTYTPPFWGIIIFRDRGMLAGQRHGLGHSPGKILPKRKAFC